MYQRGVSKKMVETIIASSTPFKYVHGGTTKIGHYDAASQILVTIAGDTITTVMAGVSETYIENLKKRTS